MREFSRGSVDGDGMCVMCGRGGMALGGVGMGGCLDVEGTWRKGAVGRRARRSSCFGAGVLKKPYLFTNMIIIEQINTRK